MPVRKPERWESGEDAPCAMTYDRYGHPVPGSEAEAAGLLDAYLREQTR